MNRVGLIHLGLRTSVIMEMAAILRLVIRRYRFFAGLFTWDSCLSRQYRMATSFKARDEKESVCVTLLVSSSFR
jgi:hypothetical protein